MTHDELRKLADCFDPERMEIAIVLRSAADAWEAERAQAAADVCMWRDCEERNADLRRRLEAAERENTVLRKSVPANKLKWLQDRGMATRYPAALAGRKP